ncbi:hypothetical protein CU098_002952 [Rhizopus stolonifer]|uniref:Phorbol-ester/DAG-type domain-containing protein n=1 Tax=Rhizopus stolonifer TaxID=4846 RepID=A0A367JNW3_RHIST|nr:hypothetical protein CU098_002952 [Rhizopus stolonifer]
MPHSFEETNFSRLTYCDHCQGLLWGLVKQGLQCSGCGAVCHKQCEKAMPDCKQEKLIDNPVIYRKEETPATKSLRTLQQQLDIPAKETANQLSTEAIENVLVSAAIHASSDTSVSHAYLASLPPLNPQNTAKNFSRFVSRCGPMFTFRDKVIMILSWDKPVDTWIALLIYCFVCLHPTLIVFLPHVVLCYMILVGYQTRHINTKQSVPTPSPSSQPNSTKRNHFAATFFPTAFDETSPEYLKNMQNLQNMMGQLSDVYDILAAQSHFIDWSNERETMAVFQAVCVSCVPISLVVWCVPLNLLCLVAGVKLMPQLQHMAQDQISWVSRWYHQIQDRLDEQEHIKEMSLYENQRWWSGSGFIPHMLPDERGLWSDMSGEIDYVPKEELPAPEGYQWIQDNWTLDETGPWMDDMLGIVIVSPENGGWVYTDNEWKPTKQEHVTRRRRWVRKCEKIK